MPGSYTDTIMWKYSDIKRYIEALRRDENIIRNEGKYYILADTGYSASKILLTKVANARPYTMKYYYNAAHGHARSWVEQSFGQLLMRWRCLGKERRLHYSPEKCENIIIACCVLHNFQLSGG